jgi:hypothetical protein
MRHILILLIPLLLAACNEAAPPVKAAEPPDPYAGMSPRDRVRAICEKEYAGEDEEARTSHEEGWNGLLDKLPVFLGDCE